MNSTQPEEAPMRATHPHVDVPTITKTAERDVARRLKHARSETGRLKIASQVSAKARAEAADLRMTRNALYATLYAHAPRRRGLHDVAGLRRTQAFNVRTALLGALPHDEDGNPDYDALAQQATAAGFPPPPDEAEAVAALHAVAARVVYLDAFAENARAVRDQLAQDLMSSGTMTQAEVAALMGVDPSLLVRHNRARAEAASR